MERSWYLRLSIVLAAAIAAWVFLWPSLGTWLWVPDIVREHITRRIAPGLDIQGGLRLMYTVEVEEAIRDRRDARAQQLLERLGQRMRDGENHPLVEEGEPPTHEQLDRVRRRVNVLAVRGEDRQLRATFTNDSDVNLLNADLVQTFGDLRQIGREGRAVTLTLTAESVDRLEQVSVEQARETISNRIDELGLREAAVIARDTDVIVEIPGANEDTFHHIREIISRTARLEFKVVDDDATFVESLNDVPEGIQRSADQGEFLGSPSAYLYTTGSSRCPEGVVDDHAVALIRRAARGDAHARDELYSLGMVPAGRDDSGWTVEGVRCTARRRLEQYVHTLESTNPSRIPPGRQLAVGRYDIEDAPRDRNNQADAWRTYFLFDRAEVTGDDLEDAQVSFDPQDNKPEVAFRMNPSGASNMARLTGSNVRRRMAIVLDDRVESAPVIQSRISSQGRITMGGGYRDFNALQNDANDLVVVLRAGALPAPIRPENEQLIGPTLGSDAIANGIIGALISSLLVLLFMAVYYEVAGLVANMMVMVNVLIVLGVLAGLEATLTLPGIAGIALTVGMAVDGNVLINERMREELRLGKSPRAVVDQGYRRAFSSILDGHVTTFIAGVVLFQFGTGPVRGFAVTLMLGIVASLFTSVFCSKVVFDWLVRGLKVKKLRVG